MMMRLLGCEGWFTTLLLGPEVIILLMLNSTKRGIYSSLKYQNAKNRWHFNIYKQVEYTI